MRAGSFLLGCLGCFAGLVACVNPLAPSNQANGGSSRLVINLGSTTARAIVAKGSDLLATVKSYKVTVTKGSSSYSGQRTDANDCTINGIAPATGYSVDVKAYSDTTYTTQIASGSLTGVDISAGATTSKTIYISFTHSGSGGYSLKVAWPTSAALPYLRTKLDSGAMSAPILGAINGTNYEATISASSVSAATSTPHTLYIYFAASSASTTLIGPYVETVNIWNGITSSYWVDASGAMYDTLTLAPGEFASTDATLAGLNVATVGLGSVFAPGTHAYNFGSAPATGTNYSFTITTQSTSQGITATFNDSPLTLTATTDNTLTGSFTGVNGANTLKIIVVAADRKTSLINCITTAPLSTAEKIVSLANLSGSFTLTEDIDTTVLGKWTPIGATTSTQYDGTFDGGGHTITYSIPSSSPTGGLFSQIGTQGIVENLKVAGILSSPNGVGGIACSNSGTILGCTSSVTVTGGNHTAGIVGTNESTGTISQCVSTGNVTGTADHIGGIVGMNYGNIDHCYSSGTISGSNNCNGGIIGEWQGGTIDQCYSVATVSGSSSGGLIGSLGGSATGLSCTNSYARGNVSGYSAGGFIGYRYGGSATFTNCSATGSVSGTNSGAFVGSNSFTYANCYSAVAQSGVTTALTAGTLPASFAPAIWGVDPALVINNGYPYLLYFGP